ncbi:hypothetical protein L596_030637 [Steinernema carpocapsae]|uniref:Uncharacterized protein n=1 Tax=Steinernema carpocapsae TaxID=34508 RepID=A0A4U5LQ12_STECR|nr:hypothetical protein L596_030637 [Steinernema carpocapsae]
MSNLVSRIAVFLSLRHRKSFFPVDKFLRDLKLPKSTAGSTSNLASIFIHDGVIPPETTRPNASNPSCQGGFAQTVHRRCEKSDDGLVEVVIDNGVHFKSKYLKTNIISDIVWIKKARQKRELR